MRRSNPLRHLRRRFMKYATSAVAFLICTSASFAQSRVAAQAESQWSKELEKYPGLLPELEKLIGKLQQNVQLPVSRSESRLLPLLPESTVYYAALPNYGDSARQALAIFRQELKESAVLHDWWTHGDLATSGPKIEEAIEKFGQLHQFLGDEIVLSGSLDAEHKDATPVAIAEIRKPGLDKFLKQWLAEVAGESEPSVRVLDPQELATAKEISPARICSFSFAPISWWSLPSWSLSAVLTTASKARTGSLPRLHSVRKSRKNIKAAPHFWQPPTFRLF